ncbi:hypothetical protein [Actinacidiphila glaucinigra]|uniref:hypothetical protein n=1 Tax=Actinacidiphila glaucinigra TaxID=235986 RepID=UPI0029A6B242|nr:hypothetical protein [Streptomyces sp. PA03-3a]
MRNQAKHRRGRSLRLKLSAAAVASAAAFGGTAWALQQSGSEGSGADRSSGSSKVHVTSIVPSASGQPERGLAEADSGHRDAAPEAEEKKDTGTTPSERPAPAKAKPKAKPEKPKPAKTTAGPTTTKPAQPKPPASTPTPKPTHSTTPPATPTPTPTPTHTPDPTPPATTPAPTPAPTTSAPYTPAPPAAEAAEPPAASAPRTAPPTAPHRADTELPPPFAGIPHLHGRGHAHGPWLPFPATAPGHSAGAPGGTGPVG